MPDNLVNQAKASSSTCGNPVPAIIIGGYLGAGKTTLLNHILSENHGVHAAVLVNDFGAINIDARLVVGVEGEAVSLANGCICCTIRDDMIASCLQLLQRENPPDLLIIETSGVSDPVQVANTFTIPELQPLISLSSILSVIDAELFPGLHGEEAALARAQIRAADIVVLNKVDLVSRADLLAVKELVKQITPGSRIIESQYGQVPLELVLDTGTHENVIRQRDTSEAHNHLDHGHTFCTWYWNCDQPLSLARLRSVLEGLPETVYRAKGIVYIEELPMYQVTMQMVGKRYNFKDTELWGKEIPRSEIVMIGSREGINEEKLQQGLDACVGNANEEDSPMLRLARRVGSVALNRST